MPPGSRPTMLASRTWSSGSERSVTETLLIVRFFFFFFFFFFLLWVVRGPGIFLLFSGFSVAFACQIGGGRGGGGVGGGGSEKKRKNNKRNGDSVAPRLKMNQSAAVLFDLERSAVTRWLVSVYRCVVLC